MRLVLLGPPGAGKGTQAAVLSERLGLPHISTGQMLRDAVKAGSPIGKEAQSYMEKGALVPDELMTRVVIERLQQDDVKAGFILDGFPRTTQQAESLDTVLDKIKMPIDLALNLAASTEVVVKRLSGRLVCKQCSANYHRENMPPRAEGVCDKCGGELIQRKDDQPETIENRLKVYEEQTAPLIDYYEKKGTLRTVSGDSDVEILYTALYELFGKEGLLSRD